MSKTCIHHPDVPTFKYDPFCEPTFCKECYERMNLVYEKCYKSENDGWMLRESVSKEQAKQFWTEKD